MSLGTRQRKTTFRKPQAPFRLPSALRFSLLRAILFTGGAVVATIWAIHRYYTRVPAPMYRPAPTEVPAPELEVEPAPAPSR